MAGARFWNLSGSDSNARLAEWVRGAVETQKIFCPVDPGHQRGGKRLSDLSVALRGKGVEDFVWTWQSECLIQDNVLEFFRKSGFTGFDVNPVKAKFRHARGQEPPRLWELVATGWAGMAAADSGIKLIEHCDACGLLRYSGRTDAAKLIDVSRWDGSDFFMVWPMPGFIFVADRVAQAIRSNRLRGAVLKQPRDLALWGFGPGRLSDYMSEERARALGGPLGIE
jgi:hypothetical protein